MGFYVDLKAIPLEQFKNKLEAADLLPSRKILKVNIDKVFDVFTKNKIQNVEELFQELRTKTKVLSLSKELEIDEDYLTILARELKSYRQPPCKIKDFSDVNGAVVSKLEATGIKNTSQLFDLVLTSAHRHELSAQAGIDIKTIDWLTRLTDLSRIRWVNHTFAYVLLEAGYDSVRKVAEADYAKLYEDIKRLNEERNLYKGHIGLHDMKLCVEAAAEIPDDIQYT